MAMSKAVRWTVRVVGVVLVVALAGLLALRIYGNRRLAAAQQEFAAQVGSTAGNPYASARVPEEENAAIFLCAGAEAMVPTAKERALAGEMTILQSGAWTAEQRDFLHRYLVSNAPALELLHRAASRTKSSFGLLDPVNEEEELKTRMPFLKLLSAQRLLVLDARMALLEGDQARFLADAGSMSTMAVALERESPRVAMLIGIAAEKIFLAAASEAAARPDTPLQTVQSLQALIPDTDLRAMWRRALLASAIGIDRRVAAAEFDPREIAREALKGRLLELLFGDIFSAQQRELYSDLVNIVNQPLGSNPHWADRGKAKPTNIFHAFEFVIFPGWATSAGRVQSTMSVRNLATVALKVRSQGLQTGAYPPSLADYPEASSPDPFAAKPLSYLRRPGGSAVLTVPEYPLLWKRVSDVGAKSQPYTWELPVPGKAAAKE